MKYITNIDNFEDYLIDDSYLYNETNDYYNDKFKKIIEKVKRFYDIRKKSTKRDLFKRDFYIFKEKIVNDREFLDLAKELKISSCQVKNRFKYMSIRIDDAKEQLNRKFK
jgi:hypothetical protein